MKIDREDRGFTYPSIKSNIHCLYLFFYLFKFEVATPLTTCYWNFILIKYYSTYTMLFSNYTQLATLLFDQ